MQFDFGQNWKDFSVKSLDQQKFDDACKSIADLLPKSAIEGRDILDIGCGSGIFATAFLALGANSVVGTDINQKSIETALANKDRFLSGIKDRNKLQFFVDDILNSNIGNKKFGIVYSWGVLHHTGNMKRAISHASNFVSEGGSLVIAIYNKHWSSKAWLLIKYFYNISPDFLKKFFIYLFTPIIYIAKFLVTRKNPLSKERGMDFYYDIIDWIGGYPYEYASVAEVTDLIEKNRFSLLKVIQAGVPTGCNEFVFIKK